MTCDGSGLVDCPECGGDSLSFGGCEFCGGDDCVECDGCLMCLPVEIGSNEEYDHNGRKLRSWEREENTLRYPNDDE